MKKTDLWAGLCVALPTLCFLTPGTALAQKAAAKKPAAPAASALPLKNAAAVLDAAAKATGASAAAAIKSTVITGTLSIPANGLTGAMTIKTKAPNRFVMVQTLPNIGDIRMGYDGKVGWSEDPMNGMRELKGVELAQARDEAERTADTDWRKKAKTVELLAPRKVGATLCYVVKVTPKIGTASTQYYDAKSLLLLRTDMVSVSPNGKLPTETYLSDYRTVDGVKMPFKTRSIVAGIQEVIVTFQKVENGVAIDDAEFAKPAAKPKPKP